MLEIIGVCVKPREVGNDDLTLNLTLFTILNLLRIAIRRSKIFGNDLKSLTNGIYAFKTCKKMLIVNHH